MPDLVLLILVGCFSILAYKVQMWGARCETIGVKFRLLAFISGFAMSFFGLKFFVKGIPVELCTLLSALGGFGQAFTLPKRLRG